MTLSANEPTMGMHFVNRRVPDHIRSDNGPEFTAKAPREWLGRIGVKTLFIEPGSPWETGYAPLRQLQQPSWQHRSIELRSGPYTGGRLSGSGTFTKECIE